MKKKVDKIVKFSIIDFVIVFAIMLVYGIVSFYRLGDFKAPNSFYYNKEGNDIIVDLGESKHIDKLMIFNGARASDYTIYFSQDNNEYNYLRSINKTHVFNWERFDVPCNTQYLKIVFVGETSIGEIGVFDEGKKLKANFYDSNFKKIDKIGDEGDVVPNTKSYMNSAYFDEIYFARTAYEYVFNLKTYEWTHPPLGKIIQAIPIYITHYMSPFNYRLMGNIAGILLVGVMYFFGVIMFKKRKYGVYSSLFMALDTFHFAHTRMGTVDSYLVLFITLSLMFMYLFSNELKTKYLFLSGLFFALSISVKWTGFFAGLALALIYFFILFKNKKINIKYILNGFLYFVFIPLLIYFSVFYIFHNNFYETNNIVNFVKENIKMYTYHSQLDAKHFFSSSWYTWPVSYKPVWYFHIAGIISSESISGVGNLIIWILGIVGIIYNIISLILKKNTNSLFLLICFLSMWLPYAFIGRIMFLYHYFPVLPFLFLSIVNIGSFINKYFRVEYVFVPILIMCYMFFVAYYPAVSGMRTNNNYLNKIELFDSWYFS